MAQYHAFLVRVWQGAEDEGARLAGRVDHLQTAESRQFLSLEELVAHLCEALGVEERQLAPPLPAEVTSAEGAE